MRKRDETLLRRLQCLKLIASSRYLEISDMSKRLGLGVRQVANTINTLRNVGFPIKVASAGNPAINVPRLDKPWRDAINCLLDFMGINTPESEPETLMELIPKLSLAVKTEEKRKVGREANTVSREPHLLDKSLKNR
jgi:predicted transcriptional regulator